MASETRAPLPWLTDPFRLTDVNRPKHQGRRWFGTRKDLTRQRRSVAARVRANRPVAQEELTVFRPYELRRLRREAFTMYGPPPPQGPPLERLKTLLRPVIERYRDELEKGGDLTNRELHAAMHLAIIETATTVRQIETALKQLQKMFGHEEQKVSVSQTRSEGEIHRDAEQLLQLLRGETDDQEPETRRTLVQRRDGTN